MRAHLICRVFWTLWNLWIGSARMGYFESQKESKLETGSKGVKNTQIFAIEKKIWYA